MRETSLNFSVAFWVFHDNAFVQHVGEDTAERRPCCTQLLGGRGHGGDAAIGFEIFDNAVTEAVDGEGAHLAAQEMATL